MQKTAEPIKPITTREELAKGNIVSQRLDRVSLINSPDKIVPGYLSAVHYQGNYFQEVDYAM